MDRRKKVEAKECEIIEEGRKLLVPSIPRDLRRGHRGGARQNGPTLFFTLHKMKQGAFLSSYDIRDLVNYSVFGPVFDKPRWCNIRPWKKTSQTIVIHVICEKPLEEIRTVQLENLFDNKWIRMDNDDENLLDTLLMVPISRNEMLKKQLELESSNSTGNGDHQSVMSASLLSEYEMMQFEYPRPGPSIVTSSSQGYRLPDANSPIFAVDCEMCLTESGSELTRITLLNHCGDIVLDSLVKPISPIKDYLTRYSGITAQLLENVETRLVDVQKALDLLLPADAVLIGHSLEHDLRALAMAHPFCIDISRVFNLSGNVRQRTSLKTLAYTFLQEEIQETKQGHCSAEDAEMTLRLFQLKLANGPIFGNVVNGWDFSTWTKSNGLSSMGTHLHPPKRPRLAEPSVENIQCRCGVERAFRCRLVDCRCRHRQLLNCWKCLPQRKPVDPTINLDGRRSFVWSECVMADHTRPLVDAITETKKTLLICAAGEMPNEGDHRSKTLPIGCRFMRSNTFKDNSAMILAIRSILLEQSLCLVELRQEEKMSMEKTSMEMSMETSMEMSMEMSMENWVLSLIASAALHSLILVVLKTTTKTVLFAKIKS